MRICEVNVAVLWLKGYGLWVNNCVVELRLRSLNNCKRAYIDFSPFGRRPKGCVRWHEP